MNKKTQTILGVLLILTIAGLAGFYIYNDFSTKEGVEVQKNKEVVVDVTETATSTNDIDDNKGYTVEVVPTTTVDNTSSIPVPDLNRKLIFSGSLSKEARGIITEKINKIVKELKESNGMFQNWMDLGLYRKVAGDYEGARDAWEYAGAINPQNSLSFRNLGDLYGYYLKDSKKAEKNLLRAIENGPDQIEYYFKTAEFYREVMKDSEKARKVVQQGIAVNPKSKGLKDLLTSLK